MKTGTLIFQADTGRMDIQFSPTRYYGGLHCGQTMEALVNGNWIPTRIEMDDEWYLVGIKSRDLMGLKVRI